jgi:hypothetical protein
MLQAEQLARSALTLKALLEISGWVVDMVVEQKWTRTKCTLFNACPPCIAFYSMIS